MPEQKTIVFPPTDVVSKPDFVLRDCSLGGWIPATREEWQIYADWGRKMKFSSGSFYPGVGDGLLAYLIPPNEFYEKEPELFQMNQNGSRKPPEVRKGPNPFYENITMLALGNPRTFEVAVQNLKEAFAGTRKMPIVKQIGRAHV